MKISSKIEFHSIVTKLRSLLECEGIRLKTTSAQEVLARSIGFKSANGLYAALPKDVALDEAACQEFSRILAECHGKELSFEEVASLLDTLVEDYTSYSTTWNGDENCYPSSISADQNFWYLTEGGWIHWKNMDFKKMKVELNIYAVVSSGVRHPDSFFVPGAHYVWSPILGTDVFETQGRRLMKQYGQFPDSNRLFCKHSSI